MAFCCRYGRGIKIIGTRKTRAVMMPKAHDSIRQLAEELGETTTWFCSGFMMKNLLRIINNGKGKYNITRKSQQTKASNPVEIV